MKVIMAIPMPYCLLNCLIVIKKEILEEVSLELESLDNTLELRFSSPVELSKARKVSAGVLCDIAKQQEMTRPEFYQRTQGYTTELLKHNVFSYHPSSGTITLQSQAVATYVHSHICTT